MFKKFLSENKLIKWDSYPEIGWWEDNDTLILYHGTHKNNLGSVLKNGLDRKDPDTGMISLAFEPNTALGYASMSGGEADFRKVGKKATHVPVEDRIVFKFEIPRSWLDKYYDASLSGNMSKEKKRLTDKLEYMKWLEKDSDNDQGYYQLAELRVKEKVPAKFIVGYMSKKNKISESPENIPQQPLGLNLEEFKNLKRYKQARVEEFPLMFKRNEFGYFFAVNVNGENVAFLKATKSDLYGTNAIQIERTYTFKKYRGMGIMSALYNTLANQGFIVISDTQLSPESRSVWKKLAAQWKRSCLVLNIKTLETKPLDASYVGTEDENEVFVLTRNKRTENNDLVKEYRIFIANKLYEDLGINLEP